jgi:hypothetical protein
VIVFFAMRDKSVPDAPADAFPFEPSLVPERARALDSTQPSAEQPPQAVWSRLAKRMCAGTDVYAEALWGRMPEPSESVRAGLACGKALAEVAARPVRVHDFTFEVGEGSFREVGLLTLLDAAREAPAPAARIGATRHWVGGVANDVDAFRAGIRANAPASHEIRVLERMSRALGSHDHTFLRLSLETFHSLLMGVLAVEPYPQLQSSAEDRALDDALRNRSDFDGFGLGVASSPRGGPVRALIEAKNEAIATKLEAALRGYVRAWVDAVRGKQPPAIPAPGEAAPETALHTARSRANRRAVRNLVITRSASRIELSTDNRLEPQDEAVLARQVEWLATRRAAAARAVDAMLAGRAPEPIASSPPAAPAVPRFDLPKPASGAHYELADLRRLGLGIEPIDGARSLLRGFDRSSAICLEPLACETKKNCVTLEENLKIFRAALEPGQERSVSCERAEVGRCGSFRYFLFQGDIHRYEIRWFDAAGALVAQRNLTDHTAYCGGKTTGSWQGRIPACDVTIREELVCGSAKTPVVPPLEDVRRLLGTAFE